MYGFANDVISTMGVLLCSFYIFSKVLKIKFEPKHILLFIVWCLFNSILYAINPLWIPVLFIRPMICIASIFLIIFLDLIKRERIDTIISAFLLSFGSSYLVYYISLLLIIVVFAFYGSREYQTDMIIDFNTPIYLTIVIATFILQFTIIFVIFNRIRRFQSGFPFLRKRSVISISLIVAAVVMYIATLINNNATSNNISTFPVLMVCIFTIAVAIYIWIRRAVNKRQYESSMGRLYQVTEMKNEELRAENERLKEEYELLKEAGHNIKHRLRAMEFHYNAMLIRLRSYDPLSDLNTEITAELERLLSLMQEYKDATEEDDDEEIDLPATNVEAIDDIFKYFARRFDKEGIEFRLKVFGSVMYMCDHFVPQERLETLIGDHLDDALFAVKAKKSGPRTVFVIIGEDEEYYQFTVFDNGVPFEIDTLTRLGTERVTTYADSGGSGIGFMKTFETMRECKASLIITEFKPTARFSKSVSIRFDLKNKYIIKTVRADEIPVSDRYEVERER